jgi:hypothetical protein|tara:strand:- start:320 stop:598 length:279 start_codon:yes stop_codon:yes gene_type:complete
MARIKNFFRAIGHKIRRAWYWILGLFERHQNLYVSHNQYNSEGEIIDVLEKKFEVRKFYKQTAKHMRFKTMTGTIVELKTATPMDFMTETLR